ncbi:biopolymer transporter ExbD [Winogradskyella poriferorum]|uniref:ExbD/TolR family protein n=1 Tax=Winogradskyella poriferorum TaxID=307627 RepID=UPI003D65CFC9
MKTTRRQPATVNAGSMADIAFLLLIFFLVTTTISADKGLLRQLPPFCPTGENCIADIEERNLLRIMINGKNEVLVNDEVLKIENIKDAIITFVDNNGSNSCNYCKGPKSLEASEHPKKAILSLSHAKEANYEQYVSVQDEITKAYYKLRYDYSKTIFNKEPDELSQNELKEVKSAYPFVVSEANLNF